MIDLGDLKHLKDLEGEELRNALLEMFKTIYPNQGQLKYVEFDGRMFKSDGVDNKIKRQISSLALETIENTVNTAYSMFLFGCTLHEYL